MPLNLTEEQILQLAPDDSSVKAGKGLATLSKWVLRECNERAVWGHCQGSGKNPYQTVIDLNDIAFKCSCPSRKFPCKHGLGLLLLYTRQQGQFKQTEEPEWVTAWLAKRTEKAEKKEQKAQNEAPVDEAAQAKRQEKRHQKVLGGISDLEVWMKDLVRNGFLSVPERAYTLFDNMSRRMVDAQAPGLAGKLRAMEDIDFDSESWKSDLTESMSRLYLLMQSYRNMDSLPEEWKDEIRTQIGYPQSKEHVLAGEPVADSWLVLHKQSRKVNDVNTDIYWFYGKESGLFAKYLSFAVAGTFSTENWIPGSVYKGTLCFYNGTGTCRRALFRESVLAEESFVPTCSPDLKQAAAVYRTAMGEKVMAVTTLLPRAAGEIVAVRFVTSLTLVDQSIAALVAFSLALVTAVVLFSVWTGMFFIRSIVRPIGEIEATAAKIAEGNLDTRIENKYNDEIGKLSDTINHMAGELDKTERMKNEFISSVSHELRTPLTSIKGWVETIAAIRDPADPNFRRGVQVISSEADRLYSMVEELLDFSRMQNGLKLDLQLLDLVAEVSDAAIMVERRVELEGLHLAYDEPEEPMPVMADPARLRQVFINVLDNAVKYSPPHGTVRMDVLSDGNSAFVNISDEGRGIAPDDLENVKVKFFKGKGAVRGSGIGLAVVDEIVTALDGSVDIQSEVGRGTTVTVRLPLYKRPAPSGAPPRGGTAGV